MSVFLQKLLFIVVVYIVYYTGVFYFIKPDIFRDTYYLTYLILLYAGGIIDTIIRPIEEEKKEEGNFEKYIVLLFLLSPFFLIGAVVEAEYYGWRNNIISVIGLIVYFFSVAMLVLSRINLGKQATGILVIRDTHELITNGIYKYVRHPIYASAIFGIVAFILITQSVLVSMVLFVVYFKILNDRAIYEEELLIKEFGDEYKKYMEKSKKYIPFLL
ncbi:MAG: isoprenylcysteine carboxylmethyltransferase family protein [Candidatus Heimdallarchaeota archaeon]|nr:isoprenylcysteine carboxylmethyltransferase family protein [Candidatus Heimdallarchaeota archaeon]